QAAEAVFEEAEHRLNSKINPAAEQRFARVEGEHLAAGERALRPGEADPRRAAILGLELERHAGIAVAHPPFERTGRRHRGAGPAERMYPHLGLVEAGRIGMVESDEQGVV